MLKKIICAPVHFYRRFISPHTPRACRFTPSCSEYFLMCVEEWGMIGIFPAIWRILRCNPWSRGGYDPPPKRKRKQNKNRK